MQRDRINLSVITVLGGAAIAIAFFVRAELASHSTSETAHPQIMSQLQDIRADQKKTAILKMDDLLCSDKQNRYYKEELLRLITEWEQLKKPQKFPIQLLRCADGNL